MPGLAAVTKLRKASELRVVALAKKMAVSRRVEITVQHCIARFVATFAELIPVAKRDGCDTFTVVRDGDRVSIVLAAYDAAQDGSGVRRLVTMTIPIGREAVEDGARVDRWGIVCIASGSDVGDVWTLHRSIHFVGEYHAYVVLVGADLSQHL